jgi:hypothetical protein
MHPICFKKTIISSFPLIKISIFDDIECIIRKVTAQKKNIIVKEYDFPFFAITSEFRFEIRLQITTFHTKSYKFM